MITIFNTASSFYWYPTRFISSGNQTESTYFKYSFDNGMIFNGHSFLYQGMDYAYNNKTALFLTDVLSAGELFSNTSAPRVNYDLTQIVSPLSEETGMTLTLSSFLLGSQTVNCLSKTNRNTISDVDSLKLVVDDTNPNYIFIQNLDDYVLQCDGEGLKKTFFAPKKRPYADNQRFEFFLSDEGQISFFLAGSNTTLALSLIDNLVCLKKITAPFNFKIPNNITFNLVSYSKIDIDYNSVVNSRIVEYNNSPIDPIDSLNKDENIFNKPYFQNYLVMFAGESPSIVDEQAVYKTDFLGLKNYQTSEYEYTDATTYVNENKYIRRLYWQIHTGTNQENGYDHIYLGYTSNTDKFTIQPDRETSFQYPPAAQRVPLSSSNLIQNGAIAAEHPLTSDRIYVLSQNYNNTIPFNIQPPSLLRETGTWLCSWLKQTGNEKIWMDRYYNAAYYSLDKALSAESMSFNHRIDLSKPYVFDVPSTIVMEPGVHYKYFRQGRKSASDFLEYLDFSGENNLGSKILHINNWSTSPLLDSSPYSNNGLLINRVANRRDYFEFNGSNHIVFPAKSQLQETQKLTVSMWLNPSDWKNINGWQILGNYYNGGWGLVNNAGQISPLLTICESKQNRSYTINYRSGLSDSFDLSVFGDYQFDYVFRLQDFNYWLIDSKKLKMIKIDLNGKLILDAKDEISKRTEKIDQIVLDKNENFYFLNKEKNFVLKLNSYGKFVSTINFVVTDRIDINKDNKLVYCDGSCSVIDNFNNLWEIIGENLYVSSNYDVNTKYYINKNIKGYVGKCQNITCDSDNNIWILTWDNFLIKFNTSNEVFEINKALFNDYIDPCNLPKTEYATVCVLRTPAEEYNRDCKQLQKEMYDIIMIVDVLHFKLYKFQTNGTLISRTDLRAYIQDEENRFNTDWVFCNKGDLTGYEYVRKFNNAFSKEVSWKFKIADPLKEKSSLLSLNYNVSALPPGWHNFVFTFDTLNGVANYYIDSIKVSSAAFTKNHLLTYDYASPILAGATTIKNTSLNDVISIEDGYKYKGKMAELRVYNKALNKHEVEQIYFSSPYSVGRQALGWNINIGEKNYIERIEHLFKYQMPGSKSNYFDINIHNFNVNVALKKIIEKAVRNNIQNIIPSNTYLNKINWL
jgi:hypothetical protein